MKPKIITLCFILISISATAQNWKTIVQQDTTYFTVDAPNTEWQGFLRCLWIDSAQSMAGDSIFYFNKVATEQINQPCIDTNGTGILGEKFIRLQNGNEIYFNLIGDSIQLKTNAQINDTWKMMTDSNNIEYYAIVTSSYLSPVDGAMDSIKLLTIQTFLNGNPVNHYYNNKIIILSKDHGILSQFQLENFPYEVFPVFNMFDLHPKLPYLHRRVDQSVKNRNFYFIDFMKKYASGNEWITEKSDGYGPFNPPNYSEAFWGETTTIHDSIVGYSFLTPNTIECTFQRKTYYKYVSNYLNANSQFVDSVSIITNNSVITDTISQDTLSWFISPRTCLDIYHGHENSYSNILYTFIDTFCNNFALNGFSTNMESIHWNPNCYNVIGSLSGYSIGENTLLSDYGFTYGYSESRDWGMHLIWNKKSKLIYFKSDSCTMGSKINVLTLATKNLNKAENDIKVFPNPTQKFLTVSLAGESSVGKITILDLTGNVMIEDNLNNKQIDISNLVSGLYIVNIKTDKGVYRKKILKN